MEYQLSSDQLTLLFCRLSVEEEEDETVVRSFPKMCAFSVEVMGQELIFLTSGLCILSFSLTKWPGFVWLVILYGFDTVATHYEKSLFEGIWLTHVDSFESP